MTTLSKRDWGSPRGLRLLLAGALVLVISGAFAVYASASSALPMPTITAQPAGQTTQTSASFAFTDSQRSVTFQCSLDGAAFTTCQSAGSYLASALTPGSHTFQVRAIASGQTSGVASFSWTIVGTPPPPPTLAMEPPPVSTLSAATFIFYDSNPLALLLCRLDSAPFAPCGLVATYSGLSQGQHTFQVKASDWWGDVSAPVSYTWGVYSQPPPAPGITQSPANPTTSTSATFAFSDTETGISFECSRDSAAWTACTSPMTYSALTTGAHTFAVRAVDPADHRSSATQFGWQINQPPSQPFTITGTAPRLLYPGAPAQAIPVTLTNPNSVPIDVTNVTVAVTGSPAGCSASTNLALTQSNASATAAVTVPANGSVTLPAQGVSAPTIALLDLPINQDACENGAFKLAYTGSSHS